MHRRLVLVGLTGLAATGCDAPARLDTLPERLRGEARFHGLPADVRIVLDGSDDAALGRMALDALRREIAWDARSGVRELGPATFLALSGGGENGAWGAGLLTGWTALGTRPDFRAVTGVSTGALIAPFAFLGPDYDRHLERFYTTIGKDDVMTSRGLLSGLLSDSLFDSTPLLHLIRAGMTPEMVSAIAREYRDRGRLLCVATTNLDLSVAELWNLGAIANSGQRDAPELITRILLASASIPGVFPPVMIDLEAGGQHFQEMHVDGGTVAQVVLYPSSFAGSDLQTDDPRLRREIAHRERRLYVIRNARPGADPARVARRTLRIAGRAVSTLINSQGTGDLYRLFVLARRDGIDYNVSTIPESFTERAAAPFDTGYMNRLYRAGRAAIAGGTAWSKFPPGFSPVPLRQVG
jgi:predicted acylesterase/phospholipase RssA